MRELLQRQRVSRICSQNPIYTNTSQERDAAAHAVKRERSIKRERTRERSSTYTDDSDGDEFSIVSTKKRREDYRTTVDENGVEAIDLT